MMTLFEQEYISTWVSHSVVGIVATIAVFLRFYARIKKRATLGWDDWFAFLALLTMWGDYACAIRGEEQSGLTLLKHKTHFLLEEYTPSLKYDSSIETTNQILALAFASEYFTTGSETFARISVIFLYYRIFGVKCGLSLWLKTVAALSVIWFIVVVFVITFQCQPVAAVVNATIQGVCLSAQLQFVAGEGISLGLDVVLAVLAFHTIWNLHLPRKQRVNIAILFLVGSLVIVTQIVRMVLGYKPNATDDESVRSLDSLTLWTGLHLSFAVICACLPTLRMFMPQDDGTLKRGFHRIYQSLTGASYTRIWKNTSAVHTTEPPLPTHVRQDSYHAESGHWSDKVPLKAYRSRSTENIGLAGPNIHQG
ncbi:hypothetical protein F4779DRAFT_109788 [Xylariaceae sp. FL0662B]|nr:hypothetical protein F4779DRAFT_109788 [Xylariaceae sp. FL0662B]